MRVAEREAKRVADFAIRFRELRHHRFGDAHVRRVILRDDPDAQQIGAPFAQISAG